jgi:membrane protein implicated in regulation of membrane protease activity
MVLFYVCSPVVNAWYLAPIIMLAVFQARYSVLLWSAMAAAISVSGSFYNQLYLHIVISIFYVVFIYLFFRRERQTLTI